MLHRDSDQPVTETGELLNKAIRLNPRERFLLVEALIESLNEPDKNIDEIWAEESGKRLKAYRDGKFKGIPAEEILG